MREITIGDQQVKIRASNVALLFYKQEFSSDLITDFIKMLNVSTMKFDGEGDPQLDATDIEDMLSRIDFVYIFQIAWAMAKAEALGKQDFPSFPTWFDSFPPGVALEENTLSEIMLEASAGFFSTAAARKKLAKAMR